MFTYNENIEKRLHGGYIDIALTTTNEKEMLELIKVENPFVNRNLAKNENTPLNIMHTLLDEYPAYRMCTYMAKNKKIDKEIKEKLFVIGRTIYKDSLLTEELNKIFKTPKIEQIKNNIENHFLTLFSYIKKLNP